MSELNKDFRKYVKSKFPFSMTTLDSVIKTTEKARGYLSPSILEEREMHVTQLDVFSRLMMDRQIFFGTEVTDDTANIIVAQLLYLASISEDEPIKMYINSPGGSVYAGYGILDTMAFVKPNIITINTGLAASMGAMILMCGSRGNRHALEHSRTMIHQPLGGFQGQASDIEITAKEILKLKDELTNIICQRSGQNLEKVKEDIERDHWLTAAEAKDYGLVDDVIQINWD